MQSTLRLIKRNIALYVLWLPAAIQAIVLAYIPMYGVQIAFRDFKFADGITGSAWVGLKWIKLFVDSPLFMIVLRNTVILSLYSFFAGFPMPIILALVMHNLPSQRFKKLAQTITYMPNFISTVVIVGMLSCFFSINSGWVNNLIKAWGGQAVYLMGEAKYFRHVYVLSSVWQTMGWSSIIYLAALTNVDPTLREAAVIDGASKLQCVLHVDIPTIMPIITMSLIMSIGSLLGGNFEKAYLMQNGMNLDVSEIISTYTYKMGMLKAQHSFSTAVGLLNTVVNFMLLQLANWIASRVSDYSLW